MLKRIFDQLISAVRQGNGEVTRADKKAQMDEKLKKLGIGRAYEVRRQRQEKKLAKK